MTAQRLLLTGVFGPFGVKNEYAEATGMQMELLNNQITRGQGVHSPRQSYWTFPLYLLAENISVPSTVLDFPAWKDFTRELKKGYTHVGINFIAPNVWKAKRMAEHVRKHHPGMKIILGGHGTIIPEIERIVPCDAVCHGEGVRWLRAYFGEDADAPVRHPAILGPAYEYIYGAKGKPKGGVILPGVGCENGCVFCMTTHQFGKKYVPFLGSGKEFFDACLKSKFAIGSSGFTVIDENFLKNPRRARELLEEMTARNMPFVFDIFSSAEVIREVGIDFLVRLGVRMVWIGVESKANAHKKTKGIDLKELIAELRSKGIVVNASAILFQEHHDAETMRDDINWVIGLGSDTVQFMNYTAFPRTALYEKFASEGLMKKMDFRHAHGQGELGFHHPNFKNPKEHYSLLKEAFRKKYLTDGPGVLNMALTAVRGYRKAVSEYINRQAEGLTWDPETLRYVKSDSPAPDEFMLLRIRKMERVARNIRLVLPAAFVFSPNMKARRKALRAMALCRATLGRLSMKDRLTSWVMVATGLVEQVRLWAGRLAGRESIVRQPSMRRTEFPISRVTVRQANRGPIVLLPYRVTRPETV